MAVGGGDPGIEMFGEPISLVRLNEIAGEQFGDMVKAVVDVERRIMAIGGAMHADEEALLLAQGSIQRDVWGINIYPAEYPEGNWIEFDSMINIRPSQGNRSRSVDDPSVREAIRQIVLSLVRTDD